MLKSFRLTNTALVPSKIEQSNILIVQINSQEEKDQLFPSLPIAERDLLNALDNKEMGRIHFHPDYHTLIIKVPENTNKNKSFSLETNTLGIFLTPDTLICVSSHPWIENELLSIGGASSPTALLLKIIDSINHHFHQHLRVIHQALNEWEADLAHTIDREYFQHIYAIQKGLVFYINALDSNHKLIEKIAVNKSKLQFNDECNDILDDLLIDTLQTYQQAKDYADVLSGLSQTMAAIVNNQLNERIGKLTIISLCVMVPTLVVSLFSMNVDLPIVQHGSHDSFWFIFTLAVFSVVFMLWLWKVRKW